MLLFISLPSLAAYLMDEDDAEDKDGNEGWGSTEFALAGAYRVFIHNSKFHLYHWFLSYQRRFYCFENH